MTTEILAVLTVFSSEFSRSTLKKIQILLTGAILCRGPGRISSILRVMGLASEDNFSKYHYVFSRAKWDGLILAKIMLGLLIELLPSSWPLLFLAAIDAIRIQTRHIPRGIGHYHHQCINSLWCFQENRINLKPVILNELKATFSAILSLIFTQNYFIW